jgi:hypothetical protein
MGPGGLPEFPAVKSVKIVVKLEKAGQVLAQSELKVDNPKYLKRRTGKAFMQLYKDHPDLSLFEEGVYLRFEQLPVQTSRKRSVLRRKSEFLSHK